MPLLLRDEAGAPLDPQEVEVSHRPESSEAADFRVVVEDVGEPAHPALIWWGRGRCRIDIDTIVVRRAGREMRLLPRIHRNSLADPGLSRYVVDTPPFTGATLELDPLPVPERSVPERVPASAWRRATDPCEAPD
jgi:hypothetical protein